MEKETILKLRKICKNIKVLYVEDDKNISEQIQRLLKKIFTKIDVEENGYQGIQNYQKNRHDIVITDISMPVMNGIEMSKEIKRVNSEQSIIVTSAHNDIEYLTRLIEIGVDKFILKPIDINSFISSIAKVAVNIYREKREAILEKKIKEQEELQAKILNNMFTPLVLIEDGVIKYTNTVFKKNFLPEASNNRLESFEFRDILKNEKFISMNNKEIVEYLQLHNRLHSVFEINLNIFRRYKIDVVELEDKNSCLINFLNIDSLNIEFERIKSEDDYFPKREEFRHKIANIISTSEVEYTIFCIGLRNIPEYVKRYGGKKMNSVYLELTKNLKKDFEQEIESGEINIYFFDRNRYIILIKNYIKNQIIEKLNSFGDRYSYISGISQPFLLNIISEQLNKNIPLSKVMENTEGMLYLFC